MSAEAVPLDLEAWAVTVAEAARRRGKELSREDALGLAACVVFVVRQKARGADPSALLPLERLMGFTLAAHGLLLGELLATGPGGVA